MTTAITTTSTTMNATANYEVYFFRLELNVCSICVVFDGGCVCMCDAAVCVVPMCACMWVPESNSNIRFQNVIFLIWLHSYSRFFRTYFRFEPISPSIFFVFSCFHLACTILHKNKYFLFYYFSPPFVNKIK